MDRNQARSGTSGHNTAALNSDDPGPTFPANFKSATREVRLGSLNATQPHSFPSHNGPVSLGSFP